MEDLCSNIVKIFCEIKQDIISRKISYVQLIIYTAAKTISIYICMLGAQITADYITVQLTAINIMT